VGQMKYFIQLVPTMYEYLDGRVLFTNQFSVAEHFAESDLTTNHFQLPGMWCNNNPNNNNNNNNPNNNSLID
jgi:hypothetical protein